MRALGDLASGQHLLLLSLSWIANRPCKHVTAISNTEIYSPICSRECRARSAKFWMSANTRTLVLSPFHKFLVLYQGFFYIASYASRMWHI